MNKTHKGIIKGYKGIMDLDLSLVPDQFIKIAIEQHEKDIKDYNKYQSSLKPFLRYENTIERVEREKAYFLEKQRQRQNKEYIELCKRTEIYNNCKKN
jgi:hypothetical protein